MRRRRLATRWATVVSVGTLAASSLVLIAPEAQAIVVNDVVATARGQAVEVHTSVPNLDNPQTPRSSAADIAQATSRVDSNGPGAVTADGVGRPLRVHTPGFEDATFAESSHHSPSAEANPDTAAKVMASVAGGVASAEAVSSSAASTPTSATDRAVVAKATVLPNSDPSGTRPALQTTDLEGTSQANGTSGTPGVASSAATGKVSVTGGVIPLPLPLAGTSITVEAATASAQASLSPLGATATCTVLAVTIGTLPKIEPFSCTSPPAPINLPPAGPTLARISFGDRFNTSETGSAASAGIAAVTIAVFNPLDPTAPPVEVIRLGIAEAAVSRAPRAGLPVCPVTTARIARGSAQGEVLRVRAVHAGVPQVQADLAFSDARIDQAGVAYSPTSGSTGPNLARGTSLPLATRSFPAPVPPPTVPTQDPSDVVAVLDTMADAPPPSSESTTVLTLAPPVPTLPSGLGSLSGRTLTSSASASAPIAGDGQPAPTAQAQNAVERLNALITPEPLPIGPIPAAATAIASSAKSTRNPDDVTSTSSETAADVSTTVAGVPIEAVAVSTPRTEAVATGTPGGASATTGATFLSLRVASVSIAVPADTDGDGVPGPSTVVVAPVGPTLATVHFGEVDRTTRADGTFASISVNLARIVLFTGDEIVLGHTEAMAEVPAETGPSAVVTKDVDIHWDGANAGSSNSYGDAGKTVAPHQKYSYRICVTNGGRSTLTNLVVTDVLHAALRVIALPPGVTAVGNTVTKTIGSLAPQATEVFAFVVEVLATTPVGVIVPNTATATATGMPQVSSNTVTNPVGYSTAQPALQVVRVSDSFNTTTRVFTATRKVVNNAAAGRAFNVVVDKITLTNGVTLLQVTPSEMLPITPSGCGSPCTLNPGQGGTFVVRFLVPAGVTRFFVEYREGALDGAGQPYRFD